MKRGFTLIELLISISIAAILFTIGYASFTSFNRRQILDQAASELKSNLRMAQQKASSGEKPTNSSTCEGKSFTGWYASFTSTSYTIYGQCYDPISESYTPFGSKLVDLSKRKLIFLSPPSNPIQFKPLAQGVSFGSSLRSLTLTLSGFSLTKKVIITSVGGIRIE